MDENKEMHRLRVITFGEDGADRNYFVEQIGDTSHHLIPSKKIISNNNSKDEDIHTTTARECGDNLYYNVKTNQRITNINHINHPDVPNSTIRDKHLRNVRTSQRTDDTTKPSRPDQFSSKDQTALNAAIKRLTAKRRQSPSPISNRERKQCPEVLIQNTPQRENDVSQHSPCPKRVRSNTRNKKFEPIPAKRERDGSPKTTKRATIRRSAANLFRMPCKRNLTNHAHYRTLNIDDVKRSVSHHSYICSDRIKQIFEPNTSKPKTKNKYFSKLRKRNDDVNIIFSREAPKTNDSKDSNDIFGFRKHNRFRSSVSVYQQYKSHILRPKRTKSNKFFNVKKSYSTDHIPLRIMTSRRTKSAKSAESVHGSHFFPHVHRINVVEFPEDFCNNRLYGKRHKSFENFGIDPSSKLYVCNDAECETARVPVESVGLDPDNECQSCNKLCFDSFGPKDGKDHSIILTVVKYILFGLAILAWSPCILMVIICWLITYPLRPNCIRAQGAKKGMIREPCGVCPGPDQGFWTSFVEWIKSMEWFNRDAYKAVVSLVKKESKAEDVECKHQLHPDPNRQYTLYHSAERGWVMKPTRFEGKRMKILNVLCDPLCPHKRAPKKQPVSKNKDKKVLSYEDKDYPYKKAPETQAISKNKDKKKFCITTSANMPSDFGTVPPAQIEYRKYSKKNTRKNNAITSQPRSQPPPQLQDKKHKKRKNTHMCPPCARARQAAEADAKARQNAEAYPKARGRRNPHQLRVGNQVKGKTKNAKKRKLQNEKKTKLTGPKHDTRHVGHVKYKIPPKKERRKFRSKKKGNFLQRYYNNFTHEIRATEKAVWFPEFKCGHVWVQTLKEKPCFWVYKICPTFYPACLDCRKQLGSCCHFVLFCLSTFVWFPPIFCCYLCLQAYCRFFN